MPGQCFCESLIREQHGICHGVAQWELITVKRNERNDVTITTSSFLLSPPSLCKC